MQHHYQQQQHKTIMSPTNHEMMKAVGAPLGFGPPIFANVIMPRLTNVEALCSSHHPFLSSSVV